MCMYENRYSTQVHTWMEWLHKHITHIHWNKCTTMKSPKFQPCKNFLAYTVAISGANKYGQTSKHNYQFLCTTVSPSLFLRIHTASGKQLRHITLAYHCTYSTCVVQHMMVQHYNLWYCMVPNFWGAQFLWIGLPKAFAEIIFGDGESLMTFCSDWSQNKMVGWLHGFMWDRETQRETLRYRVEDV